MGWQKGAAGHRHLTAQSSVNTPNREMTLPKVLIRTGAQTLP